MKRRARGTDGVTRPLFARLVATHLLTAAGVLTIAILLERRILEGAWVIVASFAGLAMLVTALALLVARSVAFPLNRIRDEIERASGTHLPALPEAGSSGLATAVNRLARDLTARIEQLRDETALREEILSSMDHGIVLAEGATVVYANAAAEELFGSLGGRALPPEIQQPAGDQATSQELVLHHPVYRELRCTSARVGDGKLLVVAQDVTEARRVERIRRDFVANASHELKTPTAGILATAETLEHAIEHDPETAQRFAETLRKEATRLSNLVQDLLSLARLEQAVEPDGTVDLSTIVDGIEEELRATAEAKGLKVDASVDPGVTVAGRAEDLELMVRNLLDNAIRYTSESGRITVRLARTTGRAELSITDTGIGIPARELARIFERFYRVDKARSRDTGGTGLGLAIVRHVAESHGGAVTAESQLGAGSTFTVTLPLSR